MGWPLLKVTQRPAMRGLCHMEPSSNSSPAGKAGTQLPTRLDPRGPIPERRWGRGGLCGLWLPTPSPVFLFSLLPP